MRRAMGTIALLLGVLVVTGPVLQVSAPEKTPDLSWLNGAEGRNFHYELSNATFSQEFNATVVHDDGNTQHFRMWVTQDGTDQLVRNMSVNKTRDILNITGAMTYMWINATNVLEGEVELGNTTYTLNALASDDTVTVFDNATQTFKFSTTNGWLLEADLGDLDLNWTMLDTSVGVTAPSGDPMDLNPELFCNRVTNKGLGDFDDAESDRRFQGIGVGQGRLSTVNICYKSNPNAGECTVRGVAVSQSTWPYLLVFYGQLTYLHTFDGAILGPFGGVDGRVVINFDKERPLWTTFVTDRNDFDATVGEDAEVVSHTINVAFDPDRDAVIQVDYTLQDADC